MQSPSTFTLFTYLLKNTRQKDLKGSQCYLRLPFNDLSGVQWQFNDLMGDASYVRNADELSDRGLYLKMQP